MQNTQQIIKQNYKNNKTAYSKYVNKQSCQTKNINNQ